MKRFIVVYEGRNNGYRAEWSTKATSAVAAREAFFKQTSPLWYEVLWVIESPTWQSVG